jgi:predicted MPP superfamily phosphohydrolase
VLEQEPDLILLGGDYVGGGENDVEYWQAQAGRLQAPLGVLAVLGNHDYAPSPQIARSILETAGAIVLENNSARTTQRGGWLRVAGVADDTGSYADLRGASADITAEEFTILLTHDPDPLAFHLPDTARAYDLVLAGHTHGGQVTLFGRWAPLAPTDFGTRYLTGWRTEEGVPILVSNGVGVYRAPVRFFAPPQIHVIELRRTTRPGVRQLR